MFFRLSSWAVALILFAVALGATGAGLPVGRSIVRLIVVAIVPLFAGVAPVLLTGRRRGLPDFLAATVVVS